MRVGSRLTPRQFASISLAQLAPSRAAESSYFMVCANAGDEAATGSTSSIDRIQFMGFISYDAGAHGQALQRENGRDRGGTATQAPHARTFCGKSPWR